MRGESQGHAGGLAVAPGAAVGPSWSEAEARPRIGHVTAETMPQAEVDGPWGGWDDQAAGQVAERLKAPVC